MLPKSLSHPSEKEFLVYDHRFNQHVAPTRSGQLAAPSGPGEAGASLDALALPVQCAQTKTCFSTDNLLLSSKAETGWGTTSG